MVSGGTILENVARTIGEESSIMENENVSICASTCISKRLAFEQGETWKVDDHGVRKKRKQEIYEIDYETIRQNVDANIQQVVSMNSVIMLKGNEFVAGGTDLSQRVSDYFACLGNVVSNPVLGEILLTRRGVKSSISHGIGKAKAVAFAAIPSVISNGQIIDIQQNWKGRGYDTFVVAAPIMVKKDSNACEYYCGVVVKRVSDVQRYDVHEVLLANRQGAYNAVQPTVRPNESSVALGGAKAPSLKRLLQKIADVK